MRGKTRDPSSWTHRPGPFVLLLPLYHLGPSGSALTPTARADFPLPQDGKPVCFRVCLTLYLNLHGNAQVLCLSYPAKTPKAIPPLFFPSSLKVKKKNVVLVEQLVSFYNYYLF